MQNEQKNATIILPRYKKSTKCVLEGRIKANTYRVSAISGFVERVEIQAEYLV